MFDSTQLWPGWETVRLIGHGSFGAVYEIERKLFEDDEETEKAALKVISIPQNDSDIEEMYNDGYDEESVTSTFHTHLKSIVAEYSLMRKMNGSANIVNCDDVRYVQHDDEIGWDIYIKMELLTPLAKAVPATVSEEQVIKIAKDMCAALELCQKHNIIHRDIKPQNIFVSENGDYKLGDFGIAKTVEKTMGGTKTGTYKYMAPEVYSNRPYSSTADIYSLGLVLYWLLNERRMPFMPLPPEKLKAGMDEESRRRRFAGEKIPAPRNGSKELQRIVLKACAFDPKDRYQSAREMREALARLRGEYVPASSNQNPERNFYDDSSNQTEENVIDDIPADDPEGKTVGPNFTTKMKETKPKEKPWSVLAVAACVVLAIFLFMLKNNTSATPPVIDNPQISQVSAQQEKTKDTNPPVVQHVHNWKEATFNAPKTCTTCGATEGTKKSPSSALGLRDVVSSAKASSVYSGDNLGRHGPEKMYDGKLDTNWTENSSGNGVGEYVTFYFESVYAVKEFQIYIGSHYNEGIYQQNGRPKVVTLTFSDGSTERIYLDDTYDMQTITFDQYYYTDYVQLTIDDVYTGTKYLDTVIAELDFVAYEP